MKKAFAILFGLTLVAALGACGQKGPLVLPAAEPVVQEPSAGNEKPSAETEEPTKEAVE
ncbi:MAG: lipoprotein [Cellvibrionaceae bacterium]|nr:lipoprotein [Cellvibrionaceae bacterium]